MLAAERRYDLDWLRVIAIGLLLIYHVAIGFQSWGIMIGFITTNQPWESLWIPMALLNVWRIPLLFFVSGMGVYFALRNRSWKELVRERASRILLPFLFGMFLIVPIHLLLWQKYYNLDTSYAYNPGHLWFLGNIFIYVVLLLPVFFHLKRNENGRLANGIRKLLSTPLGLLPVIAAFIAEALIVNQRPFELYALNWHGFFLGLLAFFCGFCFVLAGKSFWEMLLKWRWFFLALAAALFGLRAFYLLMNTPVYLIAAESNLWIFAIFAFGHKHLKRPGKVLSYLSQAAYPVYILHMVYLYLGSTLFFPLAIDVRLQFVLVLLFTLLGCLGTYELLIRRSGILRPFFGLKMKTKPTPPSAILPGSQ